MIQVNEMERKLLASELNDRAQNEWRDRGRDAANKFLNNLRMAERKSNPELPEYDEFSKRWNLVGFKKRCGVMGRSSCEPLYKERAEILKDWDEAVFRQVLVVESARSFKDRLKPATPKERKEAERVLKEHVADLPATEEEEAAWWRGVEDAMLENRDDYLAASVTIIRAAAMKADDKQITKQARILPVMEKQSSNVFHQSGEVWEICFKGGRQTYVSHRKGFEYIRALLAHPRHCYTASELTQIVEKTLAPGAAFDPDLPGAAETRQEIMDKQGIAEILKRLDALREELEKPDISQVQRNEIESDIERLETELSSTTFQGQGKTFKTRTDKARASVTKVIRDAENAIKNNKQPALARYFHNTIRKGNAFAYTGEVVFM